MGHQGPLGLSRQVTFKCGQGAATAEWVNQSQAERCRSLQSAGQEIKVVLSCKVLTLSAGLRRVVWVGRAVKNRPDKVLGRIKPTTNWVVFFLVVNAKVLFSPDDRFLEKTHQWWIPNIFSFHLRLHQGTMWERFALISTWEKKGYKSHQVSLRVEDPLLIMRSGFWFH